MNWRRSKRINSFKNKWDNSIKIRFEEDDTRNIEDNSDSNESDI